MAGKVPPNQTGPMDPNDPNQQPTKNYGGPGGSPTPGTGAPPPPQQRAIVPPRPGTTFQRGTQTPGNAMPPGKPMGGVPRTPTAPAAPTPMMKQPSTGQPYGAQQPTPAAAAAPQPAPTETTGQVERYQMIEPGTPGFVSKTGGYGGAVDTATTGDQTQIEEEQKRKMLPPQGGKGGSTQQYATQ